MVVVAFLQRAITALGVGLASAIPARDALLDGFGRCLTPLELIVVVAGPEKTATLLDTAREAGPRV